MRVDVLLFAGVREAAAADQLAVELPDEATYHDLLAAVVEQLPNARATITTSRLAAAGQFVDLNTKVDPTAETALIPPVSGG